MASFPVFPKGEKPLGLCFSLGLRLLSLFVGRGMPRPYFYTFTLSYFQTIFATCYLLLATIPHSERKIARNYTFFYKFLHIFDKKAKNIDERQQPRAAAADFRVSGFKNCRQPKDCEYYSLFSDALGASLHSYFYTFTPSRFIDFSLSD